MKYFGVFLVSLLLGYFALDYLYFNSIDSRETKIYPVPSEHVVSSENKDLKSSTISASNEDLALAHTSEELELSEEQVAALEAIDEEIIKLSVLADPIGILPSSGDYQERLDILKKSLQNFKFYEGWKHLDWDQFFLESDFFAEPLDSLLNQEINIGEQAFISIDFVERMSELEKVQRSEMACTETTCMFEISTGYAVSLESTGEYDESGEEIIWFHHEMLNVFPEGCEPLTTNTAHLQENLKVLMVCSTEFVD
jgi:hypothetical protein